MTADTDPGPIFLVGAPATGAQLLLRALANASGVWHLGGFLDAAPEVDAARRGHESDRLTAEEADEHGDAARAALATLSVDREGHARTEEETPGVTVATGLALALRVPFLDRAFNGARFVHLTRGADDTVTEMTALWRAVGIAGRADLPGWEGPLWKLPLVPGWRDLAAQPLEAIVEAQRRGIEEVLREDLGSVDPERRIELSFETLVDDPRTVLRELCESIGIRYDQALLGPVEAARRMLADGRGGVAAGSPEPPRRSPFRSVHTSSFPAALAHLGSSLLISTYQTGRLVVARAAGGKLNTHFRTFEKPMGIAVADGRFCLGTRNEVWDLRDMPEVARKIEPEGTHDACYLPRNRHVTGDIAIHELAFARGELWFVATSFSCLATLDAHHSFVPRWKPPFITELAPGDRCHLNGLAVVDDEVRYVTALGQTDEPGGWRAHKAAGGLLMDVPSSEIVVSGLSMPHSPRWHNGRLWVLESGRGELCAVDLATGSTETVVELPGFTRGMVMVEDFAFVGLSQIRESSTFGDLPLVERLDERLAGVWIVDLVSGSIAGFLRFDDLVQEVFDIALLPGKRYPEVAEMGSTAVDTSFVLP